MNDRAQWLKAAEQVFKLIYTGGDDGVITIDYELGDEDDDGADIEEIL